VPCEFTQDVTAIVGLRSCTLGPGDLVVWRGTSAVSTPMISSGGLHACAVMRYLISDTAGEVVCWGLSTVGQIGVPSGAPVSQCVGDGSNGFTYAFSFACFSFAFTINSTRSFTSVSAGWDTRAGENGVFNYPGSDANFEAHTCAVAVADSLAYCWGRNQQGELGTPYVDSSPCVWDGNTTPPSLQRAPSGSANCSRTPVAVDPPLKVAAIGAGARHTCALGALDRLIYCWGDRSTGQLGDGSVTGWRSDPRAVTPQVPLRFVTLSVGAFHSCGITSPKGALYCWGKGSRGQLGTGSSSTSSVPVRVVEAASQ